jgi:hypothetical protein
VSCEGPSIVICDHKIKEISIKLSAPGFDLGTFKLTVNFQNNISVGLKEGEDKSKRLVSKFLRSGPFL